MSLYLALSRIQAKLPRLFSSYKKIRDEKVNESLWIIHRKSLPNLFVRFVVIGNKYAPPNVTDSSLVF